MGLTADEQAIHHILEQLQNAWNTGDSKAWVSQFAADATFIHIYGGQLDGRDAIEGSHRVIFDTIYKNSHGTMTIRGIRMLRPDVAVVLTHGLVVTAKGERIETRPTMTVVKEQGRWIIVAFQNTRISEMPMAAEAAAKLAT